MAPWTTPFLPVETDRTDLIPLSIYSMNDDTDGAGRYIGRERDMCRYDVSDGVVGVVTGRRAPVDDNDVFVPFVREVGCIGT